MTQRLRSLLSVALLVAPLRLESQSLRGLVVDRETGSPIPGAALLLRDSLGRQVNRSVSDSAGQFTLPPLLRGFHTLDVTTAAHDNLGYAYSVALTLPDSSGQFVVRLPAADGIAASMCDTPGGIVAGRVRSRSDSGGPGLRVSVVWDEADKAHGSTDAVTNARGAFRVCGVPVGVALEIRALTDSGVGAFSRVRIQPGQRFTTVEISLGDPIAAAMVPTGAVLAGTVLDEKARPISGADVALPKIAKNMLTNERGEFRFTSLTAGTQQLVVRRIGYRELTAVVSLPREGNVQREIFMKPVTMLDTISVTASAVIPSFEENRRIGLGKFLTRAELEKQENRKMAEILFEIGAKTIVQGWRAYVGGGQRGPKSLPKRPGEGDRCKELEGAVRPYATKDCGCFALVYLDDHLIYNGRDGQEVPDVNKIVPASVEAIEYYKGPAQTPLEYATLNSECGVLVFHTRRTLGTVRTPK